MVFRCAHRIFARPLQLRGALALTIAISVPVTAADELPANPIAGQARWDEVAATLTLTTQQQEKLDNIAHEYRREIERLDETARDLRQRIHTIDYDALGLGEIIGISSETGRIISQKTEAMLQANKALFAILEPSQKVVLMELHSSQRQQRERFLRAMMGASDSEE